MIVTTAAVAKAAEAEADAKQDSHEYSFAEDVSTEWKKKKRKRRKKRSGCSQQLPVGEKLQATFLCALHNQSTEKADCFCELGSVTTTAVDFLCEPKGRSSANAERSQQHRLTRTPQSAEQELNRTLQRGKGE